MKIKITICMPSVLSGCNTILFGVARPTLSVARTNFGVARSIAGTWIDFALLSINFI
ncbi:hypothetical protein KK120_03175 [Virgibacillus dakarensis]|uniref:hypothetical protein n=1 Tax=Bacillaceae TaxID=186817 RepID=UPI0012D98010|nr:MULTISPECIES: hypothetical protein [Bacillaceae]MBT2214819.1 hypothetical protein [Virgibacillus dakarensis]